jgi:hypothetical protein
MAEKYGDLNAECCLVLGEGIVHACERNEVPVEAVFQLLTSDGDAMADKIAQFIATEWRAQRSVSAEAPTDRPKAAVSEGAARLETIRVPDLSGPELIAEVKKALVLTYLNPDYAKCDFLRDERGKKYEVMIWKPGREVVPGEEVRVYFKERGFHGNTAAFIAWVTKHVPNGYHATIPEDDRLFCDADGYLCAPSFVRAGGGREFRLYGDVRNLWGGRWAFVAFREIL